MKIRKYAVFTRVSLSNAIAYRANTLSRVSFYTLIIYVYMSLWRAIYQEGNIHGFSRAQMIWYLVVTEFIFFTCGSASILNVVNNEVKTGSIAYHLGRPMHYILFQFASSLGQILFNAICFGTLAAALGCIFAGPLTTFRLAVLPAMLVSISLGIVINHFILVLIGLSAFVLEDNFALYLIYQKLTFMLGMLLPVELLPEWLQNVAKHLPFSYVYWAPARLFVSYSHDLFWTLFPRQVLWGAAAVLLTLAGYRIAVRRLQVNGG